MPRQNTQRQWQSFHKEIDWLNEAQMAKGDAVAADLGSPGAAINMVQRLHRARAFLRDQKVEDPSVETFENVIVRRVQGVVVLLGRPPVKPVRLNAEQTAALLQPLPPMTFVLPQAATPTVPLAKEPTDEEILEMLKRVEHMLGNLNDEAVVLSLFDGDKDKMKAALDRLFEAGQLEFDNEGYIQTKGFTKAPLAAE